MKKSLLISLLFHAIVVFALFGRMARGGQGNGNDPNGTQSEQNQGKGAGGGSTEEDKTKIKPKPAEVHSITEKELVRKEQKFKESQMALKQKEKTIPFIVDTCDIWFGGIGIELGMGGIIGAVIEGYPAAEAGLRVNDIILSNLDAIRGDPNTPVTVMVSRDGITLTFELHRAKICLEDKGYGG